MSRSVTVSRGKANMVTRRLGLDLGLGLVLMTGACTKGGGDKAQLPPPKGATISEEAAPAKTVDSTSATSPSAEAPSPVGPSNAATPPPAEVSSPAASSPAATPPPAGTAAPSPGGPEPGRIAPAPGNALGDSGDYRLTGEVNAARRSQIAFRVGGYLESAAAKPGTGLKKGDVLAALDSRDFVLRLELAKARRDQARVGLDSAQKELQREQELKSANASTATRFDQVKAAADQARLGLKLAELDVQSAEIALKDTKLVAPYDCVVATQLKYDGENVPSGTGVYEVYDTAEPEITLKVPERLLGRVGVGAKLTITIPSANVTADAKIIRQVPVINEKTRTFQVTAKLDRYDPKIVPGLYAEAVLN